MGPSEPIPVILCVDVEPDPFFVDRSQPLPWRGFEAGADRLSALRDRLRAMTGCPAHFAWFFRLDPQVAEAYGASDWPLRRYAHWVQRFEAAGDEIGIHTHPYRWDPHRGWIQDYGNPAWIERCVRSSFEAYRSVLGRDCRSFRFGDRGMTQATADLLERLGVRFDLTLEPGHREVRSYHPEAPSTGSIPDMRGIPREPYRPSRADYRRPDPGRADGLTMIPVTTGATPGALLWPGGLWRAQQRVVRWLPALYRLRRGARTLSLGFPPADVTPVVDEALRGTPPRLLVAVVRSDAFASPAQRGHVEANLAYLTGRPEAERYRWSTPEEALALLAVRR